MIKERDFKIDLHPVKRTEKKYKIFPAGSQGCQLLLCRKA